MREYRYRTKPVEIIAFRWLGCDFRHWPDWAQGAVDLDEELTGDTVPIKTLEGTMRASVGDYIVRGLEDEVYPCKPGPFNKKYQVVV